MKQDNKGKYFLVYVAWKEKENRYSVRGNCIKNNMYVIVEQFALYTAETKTGVHAYAATIAVNSVF